MENSLKILIKSVYGTEKIYPKCDKSALFAKLSGTITLTRESIEIIKKVGYTFEVVHENQVI